MIWSRFWSGIGYAWSGIRYAIRHERNIRIEVSIAVAVFVMAWLFGLSIWEWVVIIGMTGLVLALEMINSALEQLIDVIRPRFHVHLKVVKDMLAGAVFIGAFAAAIVGLMVFWPYMIGLLG